METPPSLQPTPDGPGLSQSLDLSLREWIQRYQRESLWLSDALKILRGPVAEDGIVDVMEWTHATPGPLVAVHRFLAENDEFAIDRSREKFLLTYAPDGFLKRIKPAPDIGEAHESK